MLPIDFGQRIVVQLIVVAIVSVRGRGGTALGRPGTAPQKRVLRCETRGDRIGSGGEREGSRKRQKSGQGEADCMDTDRQKRLAENELPLEKRLRSWC